MVLNRLPLQGTDDVQTHSGGNQAAQRAEQEQSSGPVAWQTEQRGDRGECVGLGSRKQGLGDAQPDLADLGVAVSQRASPGRSVRGGLSSLISFGEVRCCFLKALQLQSCEIGIVTFEVSIPDRFLFSDEKTFG